MSLLSTCVLSQGRRHMRIVDDGGCGLIIYAEGIVVMIETDSDASYLVRIQCVGL